MLSSIRLKQRLVTYRDIRFRETILLDENVLLKLVARLIGTQHWLLQVPRSTSIQSIVLSLFPTYVDLRSVGRSVQFSMGVLTEFLVAASDDAPLIKVALDRSSWRSVDAKGQSAETLAALWAILDSTMSENDAEQRFYGSLLTEDDNDGPWVFELPSEFVQLVSAIDGDAITEIHAAWCRHDELDVLDDEDASYVMEDLKELIRLSGEAMTENQPLLMWICL